MSMFSSKIGTTESSAKDLDKVRLAKQKKPKKTKEKAVRKVARTVQDTIPYEHVHGKYIFEVEKNRYSVTYSFSDVTYDAADAAEQERIFLAYGDLLNSFDTSDDIQITLRPSRPVPEPLSWTSPYPCIRYRKSCSLPRGSPDRTRFRPYSRGACLPG